MAVQTEDDLAKIVQEKSIDGKSILKSHIFDVIGVTIIAILIFVSLGVLQLRDLTWREFFNIVVEFIPFYLASLLLNNNFYTKGSFSGKSTDKYLKAVEYYSGQVNNLTGKQLDCLSDFCEEFNDKALAQIQRRILKAASVSYEMFDEYWEDKNGNLQEPVRTYSKETLISRFGKERAKIIQQAKKLTVKGLNPNILLGTNSVEDVTDVGKGESQVAKTRKITWAFTMAISTAALAVIAVKNIADWGWVGIALVIFKCVYILCRSYTSFFTGYNDITIHIVNHLNCKSDKLKQFQYWYTEYEKRPKPEKVEEIHIVEPEQPKEESIVEEKEENLTPNDTTEIMVI